MKAKFTLATILLALACLLIAGLATAQTTDTHFTSVVIDDALTVAGTTTLSGAFAPTSASIGGGYGSTGCTISSAGLLQCDGNIQSAGTVIAATKFQVGSSAPSFTGAGAAIDGKIAATGTIDARSGVYNSTGTLAINDAAQITGTLDLLGSLADSGGNLTLNDATDVVGETTIGGGYGSSGCTISTAGVLQCNGAFTVDGASNLKGTLYDSGGTFTIGDATQITSTLDREGTHYLSSTSTSELSKYFRRPKDPIYVRYDNHYSEISFIPLEQCTDLFQKYEEKRSITRVYVAPV